MTLSSILFLFLTHFGIGLAFILLFVSREVGVKFFRFNTGLAALLLAIGLAFRPPSPAHVGTIALAVTELALIVYWATVGRTWVKIRPALLPVACIGGLIALMAQAAVPHHSSIPPATATVLTIGSFVTS